MLFRSALVVAISGLAAGSLVPSLAVAAEVPVAVAANFTEPATAIAARFEAKTGDKPVLSFGSSGQFYTQITQGAPFQVFLSADDVRPKLAVTEHHGVAGTVFTYAIGKLVLWSDTPGVTADEATLRAGTFSHLAIANPKAAPYGAAALQALKALGLTEAVTPKLVEGTIIAQAWQFIATHNAELGFVALSQVIGANRGTTWIVPQTLYAPIRQDAVLLQTGAGNPAAKAFLDFLKGPEAVAIIGSFGYDLPGASNE